MRQATVKKIRREQQKIVAGEFAQIIDFINKQKFSIRLRAAIGMLRGNLDFPHFRGSK